MSNARTLLLKPAQDSRATESMSKLVVQQQHLLHSNSCSFRPSPDATLLPATGKRDTSRGGPSVRHQSAPFANATLIIITIVSLRNCVCEAPSWKTSAPATEFLVFISAPFSHEQKSSPTRRCWRGSPHTSHNRSNLNCGEEWEANGKHSGVPMDSQGLNSNEWGPKYLCISAITRRQTRRCWQIRGYQTWNQQAEKQGKRPQKQLGSRLWGANSFVAICPSRVRFQRSQQLIHITHIPINNGLVIQKFFPV